MSKIESKKWLGVAGRLLLGYALILSQCAWAAQNPKTTDKANSAQQASSRTGEKESSATKAAESQNQVVKGEASESAVAEEKPSHDGSQQGIKVHGHWTIEVRDPDGKPVSHREFENSLMSGGKNILSNCLVNGCAQPAWKFVLIKNDSFPFDVPATASSTPAGPIKLTGSQQLGTSITFIAVRTVVIGIDDFTGTGIGAVTLSAGQIVQVTVVISFS
jgi:hypothetical protein